MQKIKITLEVPERIAVLVQHFVQHNLCGEGNPDFKDFLEMSGVENASEFISEMEIGSTHPDDEDIIKIKSFPIYSYPKAKEHLREFVLPNYHDEELEEDLWSCDIWTEGDVSEDTKAELKAIREICEKSDCSYFRFIEN